MGPGPIRKAPAVLQVLFLWAQLGLNQRPPDYESGATNQLSYGPETDCKNNKNLLTPIIKYSHYFNFFKLLYQTLISTSTPLGSSSFISASTVLGVEL